MGAVLMFMPRMVAIVRMLMSMVTAAGCRLRGGFFVRLENFRKKDFFERNTQDDEADYDCRHIPDKDSGKSEEFGAMGPRLEVGKGVPS